MSIQCSWMPKNASQMLSYIDIQRTELFSTTFFVVLPFITNQKSQNEDRLHIKIIAYCIYKKNWFLWISECGFKNQRFRCEPVVNFYHYNGRFKRWPWVGPGQRQRQGRQRQGQGRQGQGAGNDDNGRKPGKWFFTIKDGKDIKGEGAHFIHLPVGGGGIHTHSFLW